MGKQKSQNSKYQTRAFSLANIKLENRADGEPSRITGLAAVFDKLSEDLGGFREKIRKGAFAKSIKDGDIRALFNHDPNFILGRTVAGTLELSEVEEGLAVSIDVPDTTVAKDLMTSMKRGDITQMSFGFETIKDAWTEFKGKSIRELLEVKLFDVSPVVFPAYPQTSAQARSLPGSRDTQKRLAYRLRDMRESSPLYVRMQKFKVKHSI